MINNFISALLVVVTIYVALVQYRASHAPFLNVIKVNHSFKRDSDYKTSYGVTVKNLGNGICLDTFLLIKEIKYKNKKLNQYYISKPTREIKENTECELSVRKETLSINTIKVEYMVVYMDFFGRKYLASDIFNGELYQSTGRDNKHLERFTKKAKLLLFWSPKMWKYKIWMRKAIKQRNTALGDYEKKEGKYEISDGNKYIIDDALNKNPINNKQSESLKKVEYELTENTQDHIETWKEFSSRNSLFFVGTFFMALAIINFFYFFVFSVFFPGKEIPNEIKTSFMLSISVFTLIISMLELDVADAKLGEKRIYTVHYSDKKNKNHANIKKVGSFKIYIATSIGIIVYAISYHFILLNPSSEAVTTIIESITLMVFGLSFYYYIYEYIYTGNKSKKSFLENIFRGSINRVINFINKISNYIFKN